MVERSCGRVYHKNMIDSHSAFKCVSACMHSLSVYAPALYNREYIGMLYVNPSVASHKFLLVGKRLPFTYTSTCVKGVQ